MRTEPLNAEALPEESSGWAISRAKHEPVIGYHGGPRCAVPVAWGNRADANARIRALELLPLGRKASVARLELDLLPFHRC